MKVILSQAMQEKVEKRESLLRRSLFELVYVATARDLLDELRKPDARYAVIDTGLEGLDDEGMKGRLASRLDAMGLSYMVVEHRRKALNPRDPLLPSCTGVLRYPFTDEELIEEAEKQVQLTKRNQIRARVTLDVKCEYTFHLFTGEIKNLSETGLMLETEVILGLGSSVQLDFALPEAGYFISARGKLMWSMADGVDGCHRYGVAFLEMPSEDRRMIGLFVRRQALN